MALLKSIISLDLVDQIIGLKIFGHRVSWILVAKEGFHSPFFREVGANACTCAIHIIKLLCRKQVPKKLHTYRNIKPFRFRHDIALQLNRQIDQVTKPQTKGIDPVLGIDIKSFFESQIVPESNTLSVGPIQKISLIGTDLQAVILIKIIGKVKSYPGGQGFLIL